MLCTNVPCWCTFMEELPSHLPDWSLLSPQILVTSVVVLETILILATHPLLNFSVVLFLRCQCFISTEVVYLQRWHGWCHMKLLPPRREFCVHHSTMHHITSCKATYVRYMRVQLQPAPCTFGRMTGVFYVLLRWTGCRNKSQHRKFTLEKKILPPFQQGFEPATFQSRVRCSNHWAIPAPSLLLLFLLFI